MKKIHFKSIIVIIAGFFLTGASTPCLGQIIYQPYSYQFYQKLNDSLYTTTSGQHTALKPLFISDSDHVRPLYDTLLLLNGDISKKSWVDHLLHSGHLAWVKQNEYTFYFDYLPDLQLGREFIQPKTVWLNTRGFQLYGTIGKKFLFYTSGYENQGAFANYETTYLNTIGMIPGEAYNRAIYGLHTDWSYVTTLIGYTFSPAIMLVMGEDKTFVGDGYRSVLLSDYAANYPLLRLTINVGKVQYMAMWAYMEDRTATQFNSFYNNRRKWGVFHYIDWSITNRASLGFFNALVAEEANDHGQYHGFDMNYINPIYFSSSFGPSNATLADHTLIGFNAKYKILNKTVLYGQALFDQVPSNAVNKARDAWQLGFRGFDFFKIKKLNYLFEINTASPYTYSTSAPIMNYAELNEPLAEPLGSNFREVIGILNYSLGNFDLQGELDYAKYGLNTNGVNYGKDITQPDNVNLPQVEKGTGQGLLTSLKYAEGTIAYILNPKYNLRIEIGGILRQELNAQSNIKTVMFTVGLRSTFRNLYHDF